MLPVDNIRKYLENNVKGVNFVNPVNRSIVMRDGVQMVQYSFMVPGQGELKIIGVCDNFGEMPAPSAIPAVYKSMTGVGVWLNDVPVAGLDGYQVRNLFRQIDTNYVKHQQLLNTQLGKGMI